MLTANTLTANTVARRSAVIAERGVLIEISPITATAPSTLAAPTAIWSRCRGVNPRPVAVGEVTTRDNSSEGVTRWVPREHGGLPALVHPGASSQPFGNSCR